MGRLTKKVQIRILYDALESLSIPVNVLVVGRGQIVPTTVSIHQVHHVPESYDEEELSYIFNASDLFVYPGAVGLSAIHAMAYGLPVLTRDPGDGCMPESEAVLDGITGSFFAAGDPQDLSRKIKIWLGRLQESRDNIKSACIHIVEDRYSPAAQTKRILEAIGSEGST
jgi:glycosyltransferase involved in cell wall biosynthesis